MGGKCSCRFCKTYIQRVGFSWLGIVTSDQCLLNIIFAAAVIIIIIITTTSIIIIYFIIIFFNWYKLDCKILAELCKFFQFQIKSW